tara:strand:+ start:432 stop:1238 length:807 start_codon:yes stop_codon:yes gene_type:complete
MPPGERQKLQPRSMQANINSSNNQIRLDPDSIYRRTSPVGNQYESRRFDVVDSNSNLGMRYKGGSNQEDILKSSYFSNSYFTNPKIGNKFGNSIATFQGPDREWGEARYIFPDASGIGEKWDSESNEYDEYPIQLKGPQTWNYDSGGQDGTRTSINPNTWHNSQYYGIGGGDFAENHAPEYVDYFQGIKDEDAMARDAGFHPYFNPSLIDNNPSYGLDYMADIFEGKGRVGFRKDLNDDDYKAYANFKKSFDKGGIASLPFNYEGLEV